MIVVFQSVSGSPGVSVWSVLAAGLWPSDDVLERVVVEADLAGGVMGARYQLESRTDVLLSEASRWTSGPAGVAAFGHRVGEGVWLVPGPNTPEGSVRGWNTAGGVEGVAAMAGADRRVWFFDVGRSTPAGLLGPVFDRAAVSVLFVRGVAEELAKVRSRVAVLRDTGAQVLVAVTGRLDHSQGEVAEFLGGNNVHFLPDDGRLVDDSRQVWSARKARRRSVWEAGSEFVGAVSYVLAYSPRGVMSVDSEAI